MDDLYILWFPLNLVASSIMMGHRSKDVGMIVFLFFSSFASTACKVALGIKIVAFF